MQDVQQFLPLLQGICFEAGEEILKIYHSEDFHVQEKSDNSPVTKADLAANEVISEKLKSTKIPILSEEDKAIPFKVRSKWKRCWLVDPLDGTKEFIKRNGEFTVNIALIEDNQPVLGVVYIPVKKQLYFGGIGMGAFSQFSGESAIPMERSSSPSFGIRIVTSRSHLNQETKDYIENFEEAAVIPSGSSLKFMLIAENKADIYPRFGPTMEWDTAASHAILRGMGIEILNTEDQRPLTYNKKDLHNPFFIVKA